MKLDFQYVIPRGTHPDDRPWLRHHMELAGCLVTEECTYRGADIIESGGLYLCSRCRKPVH